MSKNGYVMFKININYCIAMMTIMCNWPLVKVKHREWLPNHIQLFTNDFGICYMFLES